MAKPPDSEATCPPSLDSTQVNESTHTPPTACSVSNEEPDEAWSGWAEVENDPAIFTALMREWGVPHVAVHEIVPLDSLFDQSSQSIFGLIFLSRWTPQEEENTVTESPSDVWFANQTSNFSCATVALMNIINNRTDLDLGEKINHFRTATIKMSPKDRGLALDQFAHVKDVHNSFSSIFDRMNVDLRLKQDIAAAKRKASKSRKRKRQDSEECDDVGFHFVAYVPAGGFVWRMDGMERFPRKVGPSVEGESWIAMVLPELQAQWEKAETSQLEYSLLSLTATDVSEAGITEEVRKMERVREDWGPFISHMVKLHAEKGDLKDILV